MLNLLINSINAIRSVSGLDSDASAFITAAGLTDPTQKSAINTLVKDMKASGLWTKMKAVYPMVGGTATSMKFNLKDPRDLDAAFRLTWSGGWTYSATGATPNGTNAYADTKYSPNSYSSNGVNYGIYTRNTATGTYPILMGGYNSDSKYFYVGGGGESYLGAGASAIIYSGLTSGYYIRNGNSAGQIAIKNNTLIGTNTSAAQYTTTNIYLAAINTTGSGASNFSNGQICFSHFSESLTQQEGFLLNQIVEKYQVALSRGVQAAQSFYYNSAYSNEANTYLYSTQITGTTQVSAINTLINGLKANNLWAKMKAVYPFVTDKSLQADMAAQMKFNLVNPQDTDAAFRLAFSGGWTYSTNGAQPNGTNGYADTFLIPNTSLSTSSSHLSFYSRTNTTSGSGYDLARTHYALITQFSGNTFYANLETVGSYAASYTSTNGLGHFIASRINNTTTQGFKNGLKVINASQNSSLATSSLIISNNGGANYSNKQTAFVSIGDGFTDAEAALFYQLIQQFQTDLTRQV